MIIMVILLKKIVKIRERRIIMILILIREDGIYDNHIFIHTYITIIIDFFYYRGDDQEQGEEEQEGRLGEAGGTLGKIILLL